MRQQPLTHWPMPTHAAQHPVLPPALSPARSPPGSALPHSLSLSLYPFSFSPRLSLSLSVLSFLLSRSLARFLRYSPPVCCSFPRPVSSAVRRQLSLYPSRRGESVLLGSASEWGFLSLPRARAAMLLSPYKLCGSRRARARVRSSATAADPERAREWRRQSSIPTFAGIGRGMRGVFLRFRILDLLEFPTLNIDTRSRIWVNEFDYPFLNKEMSGFSFFK